MSTSEEYDDISINLYNENTPLTVFVLKVIQKIRNEVKS